MSSYNILLLCGGGGSEHDISLLSANFIENQLKSIPEFNVTRVVLHHDFWECTDGTRCFLSNDQKLHSSSGETHIDYVVPCIHGIPGETGDIQSLLELCGLPYLGCPSEGSKLCFNKISTKLWLSAIGIPNTPFIFLDNNSATNKNRAHEFFKQYGSVFVKAASQGSSVGCYKVTTESELNTYIEKAFGYSQEVLVEQAVKPRELEVAVYEYEGQLIATNPGEIITPNNDFYTFEEKYNSDSHSSTMVEAQLDPKLQAEIKDYALRAFKVLKLKDLSRIDFFLTKDEGILLNEINTFPGMTPISMFPKMLAHHGENMQAYLKNRILSALKDNH